jgi:hypothetical protein
MMNIVKQAVALILFPKVNIFENVYFVLYLKYFWCAKFITAVVIDWRHKNLTCQVDSEYA